MLCKVYASHEVMIMVMEECLPCLFMSPYVSLCLFVLKSFMSLVFSYEIMRRWYCVILFSKEKKWGMLVCQEKRFMWLWSCFMSLSHVMLRKWKNKWRLCVRVLLENGKRNRTMRSNRRETWGSWNLPPWLSTSWWVLILLLKYEVFKPSLFVMLIMGNLA